MEDSLRVGRACLQEAGVTTGDYKNGSRARSQEVNSRHGTRGDDAKAFSPAGTQGRFPAGERAGVRARLARAHGTLRARIWGYLLLPLSACADLPNHASGSNRTGAGAPIREFSQIARLRRAEIHSGQWTADQRRRF